MKIQYMSDHHMELWDNSRYIKSNEFEAQAMSSFSQATPSIYETTSHRRNGSGTGHRRVSDKYSSSPAITSSIATAM